MGRRHQPGPPLPPALVAVRVPCDDTVMTRSVAWVTTLTTLMAALGSLVVGCDGAASTGACPDPCAARAPACDGCPAIAEALCLDGVCVDLTDLSADVSADVSIDRALAGVVAVTIAVVDGRGADCATLPVLTESDAVLTGSRVDVSGGPFHPDLAFGQVPEGSVLVAADGLNDRGAVVGRGCIAVDVVGGANDVGVITVSP